MEKQIQGIWTALWTPTDHKGQLLKDALKRHLDFLIENGIHGVVVGGSTGQFPYLDVAMRKDLLHCVVQQVGPERVIVNISDPSPSHVSELAMQANHMQVAAVMLLPPFYYPFAQVDIVHYFIHMAQQAKRPLIAYNFPECVGKRVELDTLEALSKQVPLIGIKQSGSEFDYHIPLIELGKKQGFSVFTGADSRLFEALSLGATGNIGGLSNAIPELIVEIYNAYQQKRSTKEATDKVKELKSVYSRLCFPLDVSALMEARNLETGVMKEVLSDVTLKEYAAVVKRLGQLF